MLRVRLCPTNFVSARYIKMFSYVSPKFLKMLSVLSVARLDWTTIRLQSVVVCRLPCDLLNYYFSLSVFTLFCLFLFI